MEGGAVNECSACRRDFASVAAFDKHRVGAYPQAGPADWLDRRSAGLVAPLEDWTPELGRRCLDDDDEFAAAGLEVDGNGRWRIIIGADERERLAVLRSEGPPRAFASPAVASKPSRHTSPSPARRAA
jgi:hypothetical protein